MVNRPIARYSPLARALHWLTAILVLIAFLYGPGGSELHVYSPSRDFDRQLHETLGLTVFFLTITRILWRRIDRQPEPPEIAIWMSIASKIVQGLLYALLFAVPLTAVAGAWLEGHPLTLLAGVQIPPVIATFHSMGEVIAKIHKWLGDTIIWVAGLHALAALFHHYVLRDSVLVSMLPSRLSLRTKDRMDGL